MTVGEVKRGGRERKVNRVGGDDCERNLDPCVCVCAEAGRYGDRATRVSAVDRNLRPACFPDQSLGT